MRSGFVASAAIFTVLSGSAHAGLVGTEASIRTIFQQTPTSEIVEIGVVDTQIVSPDVVEFPSLEDLEVTPPPTSSTNGLVDVAIDINDDSLTIDFDNSSPFFRFASGVENTYELTFDSEALRAFVSANINPSTTLGLTASDVTFAGNQLFVNVEGLPFDSSTFAQIDFEVVPLPPAVFMFGAAIGGLGYWRRRQRGVGA